MDFLDKWAGRGASPSLKLRNQRGREELSIERERRMGSWRVSFWVAAATLSFWAVGICSAYRPGDVVPMSKMGQYHSSRTVWRDVIGKHCPIFGVNREVLIPVEKPTGFTGADPYKISFQVGKEKFLVPWLLVINRKSTKVPMIDAHLRYSGSDLLGVTAKVLDMPDQYIKIHPDIDKFWKVDHWPKHILVRYTWEEQSEVDVNSGFYVLFGSGLLLSFILSIYILQSSRDKFARFVMEAVADSSIPGGGVAKVE